MYAKPHAVFIAVLSWLGFSAALLGAAVAAATYPQSALAFKNGLLRWGLATLDSGDGFLTFGVGTPIHITWSSLLCWILLGAIPAAGVYAWVAILRTTNQVDVAAASNPRPQPLAGSGLEDMADRLSQVSGLTEQLARTEQPPPNPGGG